MKWVEKQLNGRQYRYYRTVRAVLAYSAAFVIISTLLINSFALVSPSDRYLEVNEYSAEKIGVLNGDEVHNIALGYDAAENHHTTAQLRLVHAPNGSEERTISEWTFRTVIDASGNEASVNVHPPADAPNGTYHYELELNYQVERFVSKQTVVTTETFQYEPPESNISTNEYKVETDGGFELIPGTVDVSRYESGATENADGSRSTASRASS